MFFTSGTIIPCKYLVTTGTGTLANLCVKTNRSLFNPDDNEYSLIFDKIEPYIFTNYILINKDRNIRSLI